MTICPEDVNNLRDLYERGFYLKAYDQAARLGLIDDPPRSLVAKVTREDSAWIQTPVRILGGRLAIQLGAPRLGRWLHLTAFRATPSNPEATYYHARYRLERDGPLRAWEFMQAQTAWHEAAPELRADWWGLQAFLASRLRDFDVAQRWLQQAMELAPEKPWVYIEYAAHLELTEQIEAALDMAQRALAIIPWFRPGVQSSAHLLMLLGRDQQALELLFEATQAIEAGILVAQLAALQTELGRYHDAQQSYERYAELSPLREPEVERWLATRRADTQYFLGQGRAAQTWAEAINADVSLRRPRDPFYAGFAERLAAWHEAQGSTQTSTDLPAQRQVPVNFPPPEFFRQPNRQDLLRVLHHFWHPSLPTGADGFNAPTTEANAPEMPEMEIPAEESLALDGLPDPWDFAWAMAHGYSARLFALNLEIAQQLIERGLPFLTTTVDGGFLHVALVIGVDPVRRTLWVRSTADRWPQEMILDPVLERTAGTGARCLVIVPTEQSDRLEGLEFPESNLLEPAAEFQQALKQYRRTEAINALAILQQRAPNHRVTLQTQAILARYDGHPVRLLQVLDRLCAECPQQQIPPCVTEPVPEPTYVLSRLAVLRDLGQREERLESLTDLCHRPDADPLYLQHYVQTFLMEGRSHPRLRSFLRKTLRKRPFSPSAHSLYAHLLWEQRQFDQAIAGYRFAACLDEHDEQLFETYFRACQAQDRIPEAMRFLQQRFRQARDRVHTVTCALFQALCEQEEMVAAFEILEQGMQARPNDPDLLLFAAEMRANYNEPDTARQLLERSHVIPAGARHRELARIATLEADLPQALGCWQAVLQLEPLALDAHRQYARLLSDTQGRQAALAYLDDICQRYVDFYPLQQLYIDWLRNEEPGEASPMLARLLEQCPQDAWARRELALHLGHQEAFESAFQQLALARQQDPRHPATFFTQGHIYAQADQLDVAREAYRKAILQSINHELAVNELFNLARGDQEQREVIEFLTEQLEQQSWIAEGVFAYRDVAAAILEPEVLLGILENGLDEHPESWQVWSATIEQLGRMERWEEALQLAQRAVESFPRTGRLWLDLAEVHDARKDIDSRIQALRQVVRVSPAWSLAARELADALEENEQGDEARAVLEQAIARSPIDPVLHGYLAETLWRLGEHPEAIQRLHVALRHDPGYEWAWRTLRDWTESLDQPESLREVAQEVAQRRPGDVRAWLAVARILIGPEHQTEALAALDEAIRLSPKTIEAYDLKAERLADKGLLEEALATTNPEVFQGDPPLILQGRAAWIEARQGRYAQAIAAMQALVAVEPNYFWGWQQLAEWYHETNQADAYLEAANAMVRLRPDSPVALALRGEARLQTGDRDNGKEDLHQAVLLAPSYPFAGMLLFDTCLADHELETARMVLVRLQEHVGGPFVLARQAQLAAREDDRSQGLEALRRLASMVSESSWPVQSAVFALRSADWSEEVDTILRETWEHEDTFHPWIALAWVESPSGHRADVEDRLRALDRTIEVHPEFVQSYDFKAELLTRLGRYEEALELCRSEAFGANRPLVLRGREAWVLHAQGNHQRAITTMQAILVDDPDYFWGWQQLSNWYESQQAYRDYLRATEELVRLAPRDPTVFGYRGEAKLFLGERAGARADFETAFELDPKYAFAGLHLFDEQLSSNDLNGAEQTLMKLLEHVGGPYVDYRVVRLAIRQQAQPEALDAFHDLATDPEAPTLLLTRSVEAIQEAGWTSGLDALLNELIDDDLVHPAIGRYWTERVLARGEWEELERLPQLLHPIGVSPPRLDNDPSVVADPESEEPFEPMPNPLGQEALWALVEGLGRMRMQERLLKTIADFTQALRGSDRGWTKAGRALLEVRLFDRAEDWFADWQIRKNLDAWMLLAPADGYRMQKKYAEAISVHQHALDAANPDPSREEHTIWLAFEAALAGNTETARTRLSGVDLSAIRDSARLIFTLADSIIRMQEAIRGERSATFSDIRNEIRDAVNDFAPDLTSDLGISAAYQRAVQRIAKDAGSLAAWWWKLCQWWKPDLKLDQ